MVARRGLEFIAGLICALSCLSAQRLPSDIVNMGWLHGTVLDEADRPTGGGQVELVSRENEFTTTVGADGTFTLKVPPDIYSIKVSRPDAFLFQRSVVFIAPFGDLYIHVRPVFKSSLTPNAAEAAIHYFSFTGPGRMQFGAVLRSLDGNDAKMLTLDTMAVYGRNIDCDRRTYVCSVEGDPLIEISRPSGVEQKRASRMEIDLRKREAFLYGEDSSEDISF